MSKIHAKIPYVIFIIITFCQAQSYSQKTNSEKQLQTLLKSNTDTRIYYDTHITSSQIDSTLFIVGLEWGAARQELSVIKMNSQGQIAWEYKFDYSIQSKNSIPGYIYSAKHISLKGFSNTFIEIIAGERGVYYYYLFEIKDQKLTPKFNSTPCVLYNNKYINSWQKKEPSHDTCFGDFIDHGHLSLHQISYSDINNDGYADVVFTGKQLYKNELHEARRVFIYNDRTKVFNENLNRRKLILKESIKGF